MFRNLKTWWTTDKTGWARLTQAPLLHSSTLGRTYQVRLWFRYDHTRSDLRQ